MNTHTHPFNGPLSETTQESRYQKHTHTQPFNGLLSGTTRVGRYQKKHSPTNTHPDHRTSFIIFLHLQRSMASSLFSLRAWQSSRTTSLQVLFGLPLGLGPSTSYSTIERLTYEEDKRWTGERAPRIDSRTSKTDRQRRAGWQSTKPTSRRC